MSSEQLATISGEVAAPERDNDGFSLLRRALVERDEIAWERLVAEHYPAVIRQAMRACGDASTAEDIAQEVFLKVFRTGRGFQGERPLSHWIARITSNTAIDTLRRTRQRHAELDEAHAVASAEDPASDVTRADDRRRVREAVLRLPANLRDVLWLTTFGELTYEAAARELKIPLRTAMSRAMTARSQLRRALVGLGDAA